MGRHEQYEELILRLGDLARERLVGRPDAPRALDRVLRSEEALETTQRALDELEAEMNRLDIRQRERERADEAEKKRLQERMARSKKAVAAVQGRVQELQRKRDARRAEVQSGRTLLKREEARLAELAQGSPERLAQAQQALKKARLAQLRLQREVEELEEQVASVANADAGPNEDDAVRAYRQLLGLERQAAAGRAEFDTRMERLDAALAAKEEELKDQQSFLDKAVFLLGEECYERRLPDPLLAALYPSLDKVRRE